MFDEEFSWWVLESIALGVFWEGDNITSINVLSWQTETQVRIDLSFYHLQSYKENNLLERFLCILPKVGTNYQARENVWWINSISAGLLAGVT